MRGARVEVPARVMQPVPFFFHAAAPTAIYTLSLHDALPIYLRPGQQVVALGVHLLHDGDRVEEMNSDRKSTRLNSSHVEISYAVFCLKKKKHAAYDHVRGPTARLRGARVALPHDMAQLLRPR